MTPTDSNPKGNLLLQAELSSIQEQLDFETLLANLSARFVHLPPEELGANIEGALRLFSERLDLDRSALWEHLAQDPDVLLITHLYQSDFANQKAPPRDLSIPLREGISLYGSDRLPPYARVDAKSVCPWMVERSRAGEAVVLNRIGDLPPEAAHDLAFLQSVKTKSTVILPLFAGGKWRGLLTFACLREERTWSERAVNRFKLIGQVLADALARRSDTLALRQSEERLSLTVEAARAALWILDAESRRVWASAQTRHLFDLSPGEDLAYLDVKDFYRAIFEEDRGRVLDAVEGAIGRGEYLHVEFRVPRTGESPRWILARGGLHRSLPEAPPLLMGISFDITDRKRIEEQADERVRFERLLTDLSARFVNLSPDEVDGEIEDALRRICECIQIDLAGLWQLSAQERPNLVLTHFYGSIEGPQAQEGWDSREVFPWCREQVLAGKIISLADVKDAPPEASGDQETWTYLGIKSVLTFPLSLGDSSTFGALALNSVRAHRDWPVALVSRLQLIAQIFANAIARKHSDQALRESEAISRATFEQAAMGLAHVGIDGRWLRANDKLCAVLGYSREELSHMTFQDITHPDDLEADLTLMRRILSGEIPTFSLEKRYLRKDGALIWVNLTVSLVRDANGRPRYFIALVDDITHRKRAEQALEQSFSEIRALKDRLQIESDYLRTEIAESKQHGEILGQSQAVRKVLKQVAQVGPTLSTVLITGETGTGKELVARAIHDASPRREYALVAVNSSSLPEGLIESELFGREKGAYTGALTRQAGRFEVADRSTLFLDEIGDLPLSLQSRLLRVLEDGRFERLGGTKTLKVDVRIIAATNRDLEAEVEAGRFRRDLYYRLNVFRIHIPPLRERREDIPILVRVFVAEFAARMGKEIEEIPQRTLEDLSNYPWPGNVRELRNVVEHAVILSRGRKLEIQSPLAKAANHRRNLRIEDVEREHIRSVLETTGWRVKGAGGAAEILDLKPTTLISRMKKLGIPTRKEKYGIPH